MPCAAASPITMVPDQKQENAPADDGAAENQEEKKPD